jgi:ATP-dependent Clp protease, protease subunit
MANSVFNFKSSAAKLCFDARVRTVKADEEEQKKQEEDAEKGKKLDNEDPDNKKGDDKAKAEDDEKKSDRSDEADKATEEEKGAEAAKAAEEEEKEQRVLDLAVYGEIGLGEDGEEESSKAFGKMLAEAGDLDAINLSINSGGGDIFSAIAIRNQLRAKGCKITAYVDGLAASAASFLAVDADETVMRKDSQMMIHNAWSIAVGDKDTMKTCMEQLENVDETMCKSYASATGQSQKAIKGMMDTETWMTDEEAVEMGFADRVEGGVKAGRVNNMIVFNGMGFDIKRFNHKPKNFESLPVVADFKKPESPIRTSFSFTKKETKVDKTDPKAIEKAKADGEKAGAEAERKRLADLDSFTEPELAELVAAAKKDGRTKAEILPEVVEILRMSTKSGGANGAVAFMVKRIEETSKAKEVTTSVGDQMTPDKQKQKEKQREAWAELIANGKKADPELIKVLNGN